MDDTLQHYKLPENSLEIDHLSVWMLPIEYFEAVNGQLSSDIKVRWLHHIHIPISNQQVVEIASDKIEYRVQGIPYSQIQIPTRKV